MQKTIAATFLSVALISSVALAAPCDGWDRNSNYNQLYDPATVETVRGVVEEIGTFPLQDCDGGGVNLKLNVGKETVCVHLGPVWFIENQGVQIKAGDKITVKGSRIDYNGDTTILARAVVKDRFQMVLRTGSGVPAWSAWQML